jgi:hypothetical protein
MASCRRSSLIRWLCLENCARKKNVKYKEELGTEAQPTCLRSSKEASEEREAGGEIMRQGEDQ